MMQPPPGSACVWFVGADGEAVAVRCGTGGDPRQAHRSGVLHQLAQLCKRGPLPHDPEEAARLFLSVSAPLDAQPGEGFEVAGWSYWIHLDAHDPQGRPVILCRAHPLAFQVDPRAW